ARVDTGLASESGGRHRTTVDHVFASVDRGCAVGCEEGNQFSDLFGPAGPSNALLGELGALEVGGGRHTSGRAHADDGAVTRTPRELEQRGSEVSNARHAIRVAERHCTTVDVRDLPR